MATLIASRLSLKSRIYPPPPATSLVCPNAPPAAKKMPLAGAPFLFDLTARSTPSGSSLMNAAQCVDHDATNNTWTVRSADSPAWLGAQLMFMGGNYCNFAGPVAIGSNSNGSCVISGSGQLQADGATANCPMFTATGAGEDFGDYLTAPCAVTVPSAAAVSRANIFTFLYKPLNKIGQAKVRIRATNPATTTPDTEEMVIDNTHSSLVVGRWPATWAAPWWQVRGLARAMRARTPPGRPSCRSDRAST